MRPSLTILWRRHAAALILTLSLFSCSKQLEKQSSVITPDSFLPISGEQIASGYNMVFPQDIITTGNTLLIYDKVDNGVFVAVDGVSDSVVAYVGTKGVGPCEFLAPRTVRYNASDSSLFVYDSTLRRGRRFSYNCSNPSLSVGNLIKEIDLKTAQVHEVEPIGSNRLATNWVSGNTMFAILDESGNNIYRFGEYPGDKSGMTDSTAFAMAHQTLLAANDDGSRFVAAGRYSDWLAFYKIAPDGASLIKEYFTFDSPVDVNTMSVGGQTAVSMHETTETITTFDQLIPTSDFLFAVYRERHYSDGEPKRKGPTCVLKFNWDGDLKAGYTIEELTGVMTLSQDHKYLITIAPGQGDEIILKRFPLD